MAKILTCEHRKEGMCGKCVVAAIEKYGLKVRIEKWPYQIMKETGYSLQDMDIQNCLDMDTQK